MDIEDWMLCDFWTSMEAALLLSGVNPDGTKCRADVPQKPEDIFIGPVLCLDGIILDPAQISSPAVINAATIGYLELVQAANELILEKRRSLSASVIRLLGLIERSQLSPKAPPCTIIEWAVFKKLDIPSEIKREIDARSKLGKPQETAEIRRQRLSARIREEKVKGTRAYLKAVAEAEGISISRLKQLTATKSTASNQWVDLATSSR
jgi:hypothetical protein